MQLNIVRNVFNCKQNKLSKKTVFMYTAIQLTQGNTKIQTTCTQHSLYMNMYINTHDTD